MGQVQQTTGDDIRLGNIIDQIYKTISKIDVGAEEERLGMILDPKLMAQATTLDTLVLVAFLAERERVTRKGEKVTPESMLGKQDGKRLLRKVLRVLLWNTQGQAAYQVRVRLPKGSPLAQSFEAFLTGALAHVAKEDSLGGAKLSVPKLTFACIGLDAGAIGGHSTRVLEQVQQRALALAPPKTA
jgi:hypothetical protein